MALKYFRRGLPAVMDSLLHIGLTESFATASSGTSGFASVLDGWLRTWREVSEILFRWLVRFGRIPKPLIAFSNLKVTEQEILAGHFQSTRERFSATDDAVLVLHDTTEFSYSRNDQQAVGILNHSFVRAKGGQTRRITTCGISMYSSLVLTTDGLPLGLAAVRFWSRDKRHERIEAQHQSHAHSH